MRAWTKSVTRHSKVNMTFAALFVIAVLIVIVSHIDFASPQPTSPGSISSYKRALYHDNNMQPAPNVPQMVPIINSNLIKAPQSKQVVPPTIQTNNLSLVSTTSKHDPINTIVAPIVTLSSTSNSTAPLVNINTDSGCLSILNVGACIK